MISAGESSGETHGAALMREAARRGLGWRFLGLGGDAMAAAGARLLAHVNDTAAMGLTEVAGQLGKILRLRARLMRALELEKPDALVLIDFPDFNFALARRAHALGVPVIYYICPQVWAWRPGRLKFLARHTHRRALLYPFEKKFYEERGVTADWVGCPVLDELPPPAAPAEAKAALGLAPNQPLLALFPGSRRAMAARLAPAILGAAEILAGENPALQFVLPRAASLPAGVLDSCLAQASPGLKANLRVTQGRSREALAAADAALVVSGTSSVEALFLGTPMVVTYKVSPLSWRLAKALVRVPFVSIGNLVMGRQAIPELLQAEATPGNLASAVRPLLSDTPIRARMERDLAEARSLLGGPGASGRVVDILAEEMAKGRPAL